jgi:hypothetical protein
MFGVIDYFLLLCFSKYFYMDTSSKPLDTLQDIKKMMERSSRFISLSGWSGVGAGVCALIGAWLAHEKLSAFAKLDVEGRYYSVKSLEYSLFVIALGVLAGALVLAFTFTYIRSKKTGVAIWGTTARRLLWNTFLPMAAGGVLILKMIDLNFYTLIAPTCLLFYGVALVNGSKYTLGEIRYLGYAQILLGMLNCSLLHSGLILWTIGFGILHIVYGLVMWWKYERE